MKLRDQEAATEMLEETAFKDQQLRNQFQLPDESNWSQDQLPQLSRRSLTDPVLPDPDLSLWNHSNQSEHRASRLNNQSELSLNLSNQSGSRLQSHYQSNPSYQQGWLLNLSYQQGWLQQNLSYQQDWHQSEYSPSQKLQMNLKLKDQAGSNSLLVDLASEVHSGDLHNPEQLLQQQQLSNQLALDLDHFQGCHFSHLKSTT